MPLDSLYSCSRCSRKFGVENVRYDSKGRLVCLACLGKVEQRMESLIAKKEDAGIINFICMRCRYKFRIRKGAQQKFACPYCGRTELMQVKKYKDENDLIHESSNPRFDY